MRGMVNRERLFVIEVAEYKVHVVHNPMGLMRPCFRQVCDQEPENNFPLF